MFCFFFFKSNTWTKNVKIFELFFLSFVFLLIDLPNNKQTNIKYVLSQKGRTILLFDNYYYVHEKTVKEKTYWRCVKYTTRIRCHGRVHTKSNNVTTISRHNHL